MIFFSSSDILFPSPSLKYQTLIGNISFLNTSIKKYYWLYFSKHNPPKSELHSEFIHLYYQFNKELLCSETLKDYQPKEG